MTVAFEEILRALVVVLLVLALGLFLARSARARPRRGMGMDFGLAFSAFLAAWIATELFATFAPESWPQVDEILHFAVLLAFATWMNVRWRWALRRAEEGT